MVNYLRAIQPKGYQRGNLGKSHQIGKTCLSTRFEPAAFGFRFTVLPLEREKTSYRLLNFGYLIPTACLCNDFSNNLIVTFRRSTLA